MSPRGSRYVHIYIYIQNILYYDYITISRYEYTVPGPVSAKPAVTLTSTFSKAKCWNASGNAGHLLILQPRHVSSNAEDIVLIKLLYMQYILMLLSNATMLNWLENSTQRNEEVVQEHFKFPSVYLLTITTHRAIRANLKNWLYHRPWQSRS